MRLQVQLFLGCGTAVQVSEMSERVTIWCFLLLSFFCHFRCYFVYDRLSWLAICSVCINVCRIWRLLYICLEITHPTAFWPRIIYVRIVFMKLFYFYLWCCSTYRCFLYKSCLFLLFQSVWRLNLLCTCFVVCCWAVIYVELILSFIVCERNVWSSKASTLCFFFPSEGGLWERVIAKRETS